MYKSAKEMYFAYGCSEYNMKIDDVLSEYNKYNISLEQQALWKKEYIDRLFSKLLETNDIRIFIELSAFSRGSTNTDILGKLIDYWVNSKKNDIEQEFLLSRTLFNAINPFAIKRKDRIAVKAIIILEDSFSRIQATSQIAETNRKAQKIYNDLQKRKNYID